jgi:regulatory protein YycI of two-component signal transduction system YycFG
MNFTDLISSNAAYCILGIGAFIVIILIYNIVLSVKLRKLNKKYKKFMSGATGENLEDQVLSRFADIDNLKAESKNMNGELEKVKDNLQVAYQKIGVVKYDAFKEMGGKLSFVLALLDKNNNGILLNSVHSSREGCYTYLKEIIKGESFLELSEDEKKALDMARNSNNFMV